MPHGCSGAPLEVLHGWTGGDGAQAAEELTSVFKKQHPDVDTEFNSIDGGGNETLDAELRAQTRTEIQRLQEDLGVTTVYVTHDQTEAMTIGDRIAIFDGGGLQQVATPLECYHEPANRFVAGFLGEPSMNFFIVEHRDGTLVADAFDYPVSEDVAAEFGDTRQLVLGVCPEAIGLVESATDPHHFRMTADVVEPMGDENTVYLTFGDSATESNTLVATVGGIQQSSAGQTAVVHVPEEAIHVFDRRSGRALRSRRVRNKDVAEIGSE